MHKVQGTRNCNLRKAEILPVYTEAMKARTSFSNSRKNLLMQDGAKPHTANVTLQNLEADGVEFWRKEVWPENCSNFNPIENIWSILKEKVHEDPVPRTKSQLVDKIRKTWIQLSVATL